GIVVWQLDGNARNDQTATGPAASTNAAGIAARIVTPNTLRSIARALGRPVYWAGERPPARLEYTQASDGSTYVRYLTGSARAGTHDSAYVVIATYAQPDALSRVRAIARTKHFNVEELSRDEVAVTNPNSPRNIHVVFGEQPYQVEVYAPTGKDARQIVRSGAVEPVG
ncbi:MAG TPA: hypothetical protein VLB89_07785, partial [Gaiellaceae bacterium]|nr:hypothetical protein [Gaiellaceae bacterium]